MSSTPVSHQTRIINFTLGSPLPLPEQTVQSERSQCAERFKDRFITTGVSSGAGVGIAAAMTALAEAIATKQAMGVTGLTAVAPISLATGATFGAISAPIALTIHKLVQYILFAIVDKYATNKDTWKKVADFAAAAIAAVSAIILTSLLMGAAGYTMTFGTAFILGAHMLALVAIKYLFAPCLAAGTVPASPPISSNSIPLSAPIQTASSGSVIVSVSHPSTQIEGSTGAPVSSSSSSSSTTTPPKSGWSWFW